MRNLKKFLALVLALVMTISVMVTVSATSFTDDSAVSDSYREAVEFLTGIKVFEGDGNGTLHPERTIRRSEMAAVIYRVLTGDVEDKSIDLYKGVTSQFTDVAPDKWYAPYVAFCEDQGIVKGYSETQFGPSDPITGYQVAAILLRALGYGQNGEFENKPEWRTNVAVVANKVGITDGLVGVSLSDQPARQVVIQMTYNAAVKAGRVNYSPALGYWPMTKNTGTTENPVTEEINLIDAVATTVEPDVWGIPSETTNYTFTWANTPVPGSFTNEIAPVAEFETAVSECDIVTALNANSNVDVVDVYVNGYRYEQSAEHFLGNNDGSKPTLNATVTAPLVGAQGRLTQVYNYDGKYHVVMLDQFLAQVTDVAARTYDAAGHVKTAAKITLQAYDQDITSQDAISTNATELTATDVAADYSWAKGQYVLIYGVINGSNFGTKLDTSKNTFEIISAAPVVATGKRTAYNSVQRTSTVAGNTYTWAQRYHLINPGVRDTIYDVYTDTYGNLIGLVTPPPAAQNYALLDWGMLNTPGGVNSYYSAQLIGFDGAVVTGAPVTVSKYAHIDRWNDIARYNEHHIVTYVETEAGYELTMARDNEYLTGATITQGTPRIVKGEETQAVTDGETVYLVETQEGVFATYTGYQNVPTLKNVVVEYVLGQNGYADLVYVNAIGAGTSEAPGATTKETVYVMKGATGTEGGETDNGEVFKVVSFVVRDGTVVSVNALDTAVTTITSATSSNGALMELTFDENGVVTEAKSVETKTGTIKTGNSGNVVYFDEEQQGYLVADSTVIWLINNTTHEVQVGNADSLSAAETTVQYTLNADKVTLAYVILEVDPS